MNWGGKQVKGKWCRQGSSYILLRVGHKFGSRLPFSQHRKRNMIDYIALRQLSFMSIICIWPNQNHSLLSPSLNFQPGSLSTRRSSRGFTDLLSYRRGCPSLHFQQSPPAFWWPLQEATQLSVFLRMACAEWKPRMDLGLCSLFSFTHIRRSLITKTSLYYLYILTHCISEWVMNACSVNICDLQ